MKWLNKSTSRWFGRTLLHAVAVAGLAVIFACGGGSGGDGGGVGGGGPQPVAGSPFGAGLGPYSVTVDPLGRFLYVANANSDDVSAYTINAATGALTDVPGSRFPSGADVSSVTVDPSGNFAYVANFYDNNVSAYRIDPTTGELI